MKLSMTGDYAIRAMLYLSSKGYGEIVHISEISKNADVPESLLRKITGQLVKAGLLHSHRGKGGGIALAHQPELITLLDVIEVIEGKIFLNQCIIAPDFCVRSNYCSVHVVWREVQEMMVEILGSKNLSVLAFENQKLPDNYLPDVAYE